MGKCKYNIVRNGDIKHLCDDTCFKRFRTNPTMFLKGSTSAPAPTPAQAPALVRSTAPAAEKKGRAAGKAAAGPPPLAPKGTTFQGYKTCVVCQLMNINTQVGSNSIVGRFQSRCQVHSLHGLVFLPVPFYFFPPELCRTVSFI